MKDAEVFFFFDFEYINVYLRLVLSVIAIYFVLYRLFYIKYIVHRLLFLKSNSHTMMTGCLCLIQ